MHRPVLMKKFAFHPISIILLIWLFIVLGPIIAVNYVFAIVIHELGHYFSAKRLGYKLSKFSLSPYGVSLSYYQQNLQIDDEVKIAIAGPLANFASILCVLALWWVFPSTYFFSGSFVYISSLLALLNLIPAYPLDGGRLFICLVSKFFDEKKAKHITIMVNVFVSIIFMVLFFVFLFINFNASYLIFAVFMVGGILDLKRSSCYEKLGVFNKALKSFTKPEFLCFDMEATVGEALSKLSTNKYVIFCLILENGRILNLSEKMIINFSLNFSYDTKFKEIIKKQ